MEAWTMTNEDLTTLENLLMKFRDTSADQEEFAKRESLRFDVEFEIGIVKENEASDCKPNDMLTVSGGQKGE